MAVGGPASEGEHDKGAWWRSWSHWLEERARTSPQALSAKRASSREKQDDYQAAAEL